MQNISKEEENNSNIATEQNPDDRQQRVLIFHEDRHGQGGDFLVQQYLQNISKEEENNNNDIKPEPKSDVAAEESPYFSHEDVEHGQRGDFLVQQYLQNISKEEEKNNDINTEPKSNAGLVQQYLQNISKKEENNNDITTEPKLMLTKKALFFRRRQTAFN